MSEQSSHQEAPPRKAERDFFQDLGVPRTATSDEIKKAYRRLARQLHPDANPKQSEAEQERFKEITEAYATLSDDKKRKDYMEGRTSTGSTTHTSDNPFTRQPEETFKEWTARMKDYLRDQGLDPKDFLLDIDGIFEEDEHGLYIKDETLRDRIRLSLARRKLRQRAKKWEEEIMNMPLNQPEPEPIKRDYSKEPKNEDELQREMEITFRMVSV